MTDSSSNGFGIEFAGLPGSGKSTLASAVTKHPENTYQTIRSAGRKALKQRIERATPRFSRLLTYALGAALTRSVFPVTKYEVGAYNRFSHEHPDLTHTVLHAIKLLDDQPERQGKVAKLWFKHCCRYQLIQDEFTTATGILAPEGFVQKAVTLFGSQASPPRALIHDYMQYAPLPAILVVPQVKPEVAFERMANRHRNMPYPFSEMNETERLSSLEAWEAQIAELMDIAARKGVRVVQLDSSGSQDEAASTLLSRLASVHDPRKHSAEP